MYNVQYCDNPNVNDLHYTTTCLQDEVGIEYENLCDGLDQFIILRDIFKMIECSTKEFLETELEGRENFWMLHKKLMCYVDSVYYVKQFLMDYSEICDVQETYFQSKKYYRFVCDFRNQVIHQLIHINSYKSKDKKKYMELDYIYKRLNKIKNNLRKKHQKGIDDFLVQLNNITEKEIIDSKECLVINDVITKALPEIENLKKESTEVAFERCVIPRLEKLISWIYGSNANYQYTYLVNPDTKDVLEPNYVLEDFAKQIFYTFDETEYCHERMHEYLNEKGYDRFFD